MFPWFKRSAKKTTQPGVKITESKKVENIQPKAAEAKEVESVQPELKADEPEIKEVILKSVQEEPENSVSESVEPESEETISEEVEPESEETVSEVVGTESQPETVAPVEDELMSKKKKRSLYDWSKKTDKKKQKKQKSEKRQSEVTKNIVQIGSALLGDGQTKICVPVVGNDEEAILSQLQEAVNAGADLIEWRADHFDGIVDAARTADVLEKIYAAAAGIPILFTVRTIDEGGLADWQPGDYEKVLLWAADREEVAAIDVEANNPSVKAAWVIEGIHDQNKPVIASAHFFDRTPKRKEMTEVLDRLDENGGDILKLAVMPETESDVLKLMALTEEYNRTTQKPLVTMSMGQLGVISRVSGALTGSALTFGTAAEASAPGQIPIGIMREMLSVFEEGGR